MELSEKYLQDNTFAGRDLSGYILSGHFVACSFEHATLRRATLSGVFIDANFDGADMTDATLTGIFVDTTFVEANVSEDQLRQAGKLRNVTGPHGEIWNT